MDMFPHCMFLQIIALNLCPRIDALAQSTCLQVLACILGSCLAWQITFHSHWEPRAITSTRSVPMAQSLRRLLISCAVLWRIVMCLEELPRRQNWSGQNYCAVWIPSEKQRSRNHRPLIYSMSKTSTRSLLTVQVYSVLLACVISRLPFGSRLTYGYGSMASSWSVFSNVPIPHCTITLYYVQNCSYAISSFCAIFRPYTIDYQFLFLSLDFTAALQGVSCILLYWWLALIERFASLASLFLALQLQSQDYIVLLPIVYIRLGSQPCCHKNSVLRDVKPSPVYN